AVHRDVVRTKTVHQFMSQDVSKESFERKVPLLLGVEHDARTRNQRFIKLCILDILEHDSLRAFFLHDPLIIRKIESRRLDAAVAFARTEDFVNYPNWRSCAQLGIAILRVNG